MLGLDRLYDYAEQGNIFVYCDNVRFAPAVTIKDGENFNIALDIQSIPNEAEEKTVLMHELAHIATGTFYKNSNDIYYRCKMENKANKWLIQFLIPQAELKEAMDYGYTEIWDLADYFEVSEMFIKQALAYYENGHIA